MKRVPTRPYLLRASSVLAGAAALATIQPLAAQNTPGGFSLPQPTPTPTTAPQGPADERAGVRIGPRVIADPTPTPAPAPAPSPTPTATATQPRPTPTPTASATRAPTTTRSPTTTPTPRPSAAPSRAAPSETAGPTVPLPQLSDDEEIGPGFDSELLPDPDAAPIGPDDWYNVDQSGETGAAPSPGEETMFDAGDFAALEWDSTRNRLILGISLIVLLGGLLALLVWRRKRREALEYGGDGPSLARGVSQTIAQQMSGSVKDIADGVKPRPAPAPEPEPEPQLQVDAAPAREPEPEVPAEPAVAAPPAPPSPPPVLDLEKEPARIDLALEIASATRSVMMFTVEFRLDVANRSDRAVRDLSISAKIASAQRGGSNAAPIAGGQPIGSIHRIGPNQSRRISGQLQLPLAEVVPIRQGAKPLFIPLLHVTLEGAGQPAMTRSFVLGTPSATSEARVHPLPLDGPPGGLPILRAQLIKQPLTEGEPA